MRLARPQHVGTLHPEGVFLVQLRQVVAGAMNAGFLEELGHQGEHRRLRAAQIVGAVAVGYMAVGVDQVGEVVRHGPQQVAMPALVQAEHGEIGIPVVQLGEAPARHHVIVRQRQQRGVLGVVLRVAGEDRPEPVDMLGQAVVGVGDERLDRHFVQAEMLMDEGLQVEARLAAAGAIVLEDGFGVPTRRAVDEGLAVGKHPLHLHRDEEFLIALGRRERVGPRDGAGVVAERLARRDIGHCSL